MFKDHPAFEPANDDAHVWRYMNFTRFLSLMQKRALFFSRIDKHPGDPWEGALPVEQHARLIQASRKGIAEQAEMFRGLQRARRAAGDEAGALALDESIGMVESADLIVPKFLEYQRYWSAISSWSLKGDSAALWQLYVSAVEGVAISTSFGRLKEAFHSIDEHVYVGKVQYYSGTIPLDNFYRPLMYKRRFFDYEREVRVLIGRAEKGVRMMSDNSYGSPWGENGDYVSVDLGVLVDCVYVAPRAEPWFHELVREVAREYRLDKPIRPSSLDEKSVYEAS